MVSEPFNKQRYNKGWENLKPIKPGEVRNPKGRPPKDLSITSKLKELLEQDSGNGKTNLELMAEVIIQLAKDKGARGNFPALKEILERVDGKVADRHQVEGEILITPNMRAIAAREMIEIKEDETNLLKGENATEQSQKQREDEES